MIIDEKYIRLIQACLLEINQEMCRLFWNENQMDYETPFLNTGNQYENDTFTVRSYYWGDDEKLIGLPNFEYKDLKVYWYKHCRRGLRAKKDSELTLDFLAEMVNDCRFSLLRDFDEQEDE